MEMFYIFGFIALIAAIFKIIILYQVVTTSKLTSALNLLILALIAQNWVVNEYTGAALGLK